MLEQIIEAVLPYIIAVLEMMGILVVAWSALSAFWEYIQNSFMHKKLDIQFHLANGLATALEFKMAAEILKTVLVRDLKELLVLGAVILLRALLSVLIHFEMKHAENDDED
ncbi:MAG: DUF1622 domain-containing protein [Clostridia bacterium]|nr:DUF1622 domain-containing protein [Clostridia bacterium]